MITVKHVKIEMLTLREKKIKVLSRILCIFISLPLSKSNFEPQGTGKLVIVVFKV